MKTPRFYSPTPFVEGEVCDLDENASHHIGKVLRMQSGQPVSLFNGDGKDYFATLVNIGKRTVSVTIDQIQSNTSESPLRTHIGQAVSKGDRMDYMIQKSVEMGTHQITPLVTERCEVRLKGDREEKRIAHWQQVAISAAEQCGRAVVTEIRPVMHLNDWLAEKSADECALVLHHRTTQALQSLPVPTRVRLLIGPEGGLSEAEINQALTFGFIGTTLGPRVFRTETAPVAALATLQWLWGDFGTHP
ncbi:MAG: 16S rRNA (uracil(1498)-N(3))-methyltransferase [Hahellaceae bacterium]|nr:16S rRNA (uracil(1498)-N(3))-methyltransferase [Hahellaceae bacterium]MCP5168711.1 16S rRNA (uracil(1498)-N(3))-methyltransferase [Hahellaceae bacterium]